MLDEIHEAYDSVDGEDLVVSKISKPPIEEDQYEALTFIEKELGVTFEGQDSLKAQMFIDEFYFEAKNVELDRLEEQYDLNI